MEKLILWIAPASALFGVFLGGIITHITSLKTAKITIEASHKTEKENRFIEAVKRTLTQTHLVTQQLIHEHAKLIDEANWGPDINKPGQFNVEIVELHALLMMYFPQKKVESNNFINKFETYTAYRLKFISCLANGEMLSDDLSENFEQSFGELAVALSKIQICVTNEFKNKDLI